MSDELRAFRDLILWLGQTHEKPWEYKDSTAQVIVEEYNLLTNHVKYDELEKYLPSENNVTASFPESRYFYLTPVTDRRIMVPRIQLKCDFGRNIPEIRCRLELFLLDDDLDIHSLGYRYESPEGTGIHHYYHVQLTQPPTASSPLVWLPEVQPAFPIDADGPVELLLALLVSLYGRDYLGKILNANIWNLEKHIQNLHLTKFDAFEWYRSVEIGSPIRHSEGYRIKSNLQDFEAYIHGIYPGCNIRGMTRTRFEALKDADKHTYP
jgi:hypothetical protein